MNSFVNMDVQKIQYMLNVKVGLSFFVPFAILVVMIAVDTYHSIQ
jgi:hypothetical protein